MGWWRSQTGGSVGDGPSDEMGFVVEKIRAMYRKDLCREPTKCELHDVLDFVLAPLDELKHE